MGAGGIYASFPVKVGDPGFVFSASRDTSLFYQSNGGEDWPNTERIHSFSDGGFLPLKLFNFSIAGGVLSDGFSLQTDDGSTFVTLKAGEVQITATNVKIIGDIEHTGSQTTSGDVVAGGISLFNHVHGGVQGGPSDTGVPK
jgi:phage baseplate assembly protein gpV